MKINHNFFSNLAFNQAEINLGETKDNPSVGCVIVKNNSVISSGVTSINGRPHAEYNALNKKVNVNNSTMYVTLEPCTHYGLTPPCSNLIKKKKIKKVYYVFDDLDERTKNKAKLVLKGAFKLDKVKKKYKNFYKSYYINKKDKLPLIDAKIAISKDFFTINKKSKWITNSRSRKVGHLIRSKYDSIISTSDSINIDNALLNCRLEGFNKNRPDLIIIDRNLKLKKKLKLFKFTNKRKIYVITLSNNKKKISYLKKKKIKVIKINKLESRNDFKNLFDILFKLGKRRILIEAGLIFLSKLLKLNFVNDLYLFKSNEFLGNRGYNKTKFNVLKKLKFYKKINVNLQNDKLFKIKIK